MKWILTKYGDNLAMESFLALLQKNVLDRKGGETRHELRYVQSLRHTQDRSVRRFRSLSSITTQASGGPGGVDQGQRRVEISCSAQSGIAVDGETPTPASMLIRTPRPRAIAVSPGPYAIARLVIGSVENAVRRSETTVPTHTWSPPESDVKRRLTSREVQPCHF